MKPYLLGLAAGLTILTSCASQPNQPIEKETSMYHFPHEDQEHEGTWLTWPHEHTYGKAYAQSVEYIWVEMTKALAPDEFVHIIAYDEELQDHITTLLTAEGVDMNKVDFVLAPSDDVWARDTGPMFAYDQEGKKTIIDFGFDGWGKKTPYEKDDAIPQVVAKEKGDPIVDVSAFILEGGSVELAEDGTVMATKSSVISKNRNPDMSQEEAETYLKTYMGATNFIWLEGVVDEDITDAHIDGFARFYDKDTILTVPEEDFFDLYEGIQEADYETLLEATNADGDSYDIKEIPLTAENVHGVDYRGSYLNFYLGNKVLLLPVYDDANDQVAIETLTQLFPNRRIVPINVVPLYKNGGMIHCITQQEPLDKER